MELKVRQETKQIQKFSQKMRYSLEILSLSTFYLVNHIEEVSIENPLVDLEKIHNWKTSIIHQNFLSEEEKDNYIYQNTEERFQNSTTLAEFLELQLEPFQLNKTDTYIAKIIINSLDSNGYFKNNTKEIAEIFGISTAKVEKILKLIQTLEPPGVASRNLKECLLKQLNNGNSMLKKLVNNHLDDIAENKMMLVCKELNITEFEYSKLLEELRNLEPRPANPFEKRPESNYYIYPDAFIKKTNNDFVVIMNNNLLPDLSIIESFKNKKMDKETKDYLDIKVKEIMVLQEGLSRRSQTLKSVIEFLIHYQKEYLLYGRKYLKPLNQKEVAKNLGVHPSTISRVLNEKYVETPSGILSLMTFLSNGIGDKQTSESWVKSRIVEIIRSEESPNSDEEIKKILEREDIKLSRRTVAKYREELDIKSSFKRKRQ